MIYIYKHNEKLVSYKIKGNPAIYNSMNEPWGQYPKWKKSGKDAWSYLCMECKTIEHIETEWWVVVTTDMGCGDGWKTSKGTKFQLEDE